MNPWLLRSRERGFSLVTRTNEGQRSRVSWEVVCSEVGYKSVLILSEMVYVKQMHEDSFSLVRGGGQQPPGCSGLFTPLTWEEMTFYWLGHKED